MAPARHLTQKRNHLLCMEISTDFSSFLVKWLSHILKPSFFPPWVVSCICPVIIPPCLVKRERAYPDKNQFSSRLVGTHKTLYIILYIVVGTDAPDGSNWSSMHTMTKWNEAKKKNVRNLNLPTHRLRVLNSTVGGPPHSFR